MKVPLLFLLVQLGLVEGLGFSRLLLHKLGLLVRRLIGQFHIKSRRLRYL